MKEKVETKLEELLKQYDDIKKNHDEITKAKIILEIQIQTLQNLLNE